MKPFGVFDHHQDVGAPKLAGNTTYDLTDQTYLLSVAGGGAPLEQFHFVGKKLRGDFIVQATVRFIGTSTNPGRQLGIVARDALSGTSGYAAACVHGDSLTALQYRGTDGKATAQTALSSFHPTDIQLARTGNKFTLSSAVFGESYKSVSVDVALAEELHVGLFVSSPEQGSVGQDKVQQDRVEQAVFSNVRVIIPAAPDFKPYSD
jgi:hypothetical protein